VVKLLVSAGACLETSSEELGAEMC